jgi:hypothetical protein
LGLEPRQLAAPRSTHVADILVESGERVLVVALTGLVAVLERGDGAVWGTRGSRGCSRVGKKRRRPKRVQGQDVIAKHETREVMAKCREMRGSGVSRSATSIKGDSDLRRVRVLLVGRFPWVDHASSDQ